MSRARTIPSTAKSDKSQPAEQPSSERRPPRKRPWLLALSVVLLTLWIALLAVMAWQG